MRLAEIGLPGQKIDVCNGGDVHASGRLLTIAELQAEFRALRETPGGLHLVPSSQAGANATTGQGDEATADRTGPPTIGRGGVDAAPGTAAVTGQPDYPPMVETGRGASENPGISGVDTSLPGVDNPGGGVDTPRGMLLAPRPGVGHKQVDRPSFQPPVLPAWVTAVVSAQPGDGGSTVTLAVTDAAAAGHRPAHLIELGPVTCSGLAGVSTRELGLDPTGGWRRGTRGSTTVDRQAGMEFPVGGWPKADGLDGDDVLTFCDVGSATPETVRAVLAAGGPVVVVCQATVPGLRHGEAALAGLGAEALRRTVVAVVGPSRWPGPVSAALGPLLREVRAAGRVVAVPLERRLEATGPTDTALPKSVTRAGRDVLRLLDALPVRGRCDGL